MIKNSFWGLIILIFLSCNDTRQYKFESQPVELLQRDENGKIMIMRDFYLGMPKGKFDFKIEQMCNYVPKSGYEFVKKTYVSIDGLVYPITINGYHTFTSKKDEVTAIEIEFDNIDSIQEHKISFYKHLRKYFNTHIGTDTIRYTPTTKDWNTKDFHLRLSHGYNTSLYIDKEAFDYSCIDSLNIENKRLFWEY